MDISRKSIGLIKEMLTADGKLPVYNEDLMLQTIRQIESHLEKIHVLEGRAQEAWAQQWAAAQAQLPPEQRQERPPPITTSAGIQDYVNALRVHEFSIRRLKRILLTYLKMRADCLIRARWELRMLPTAMRDNSSPQEETFYRAYDAALNKYMAREGGVGLDLTLDAQPPRDSHVRVMVVKDHGCHAFSYSACVPLIVGSVHNMRTSEAEQLVRLGVLQVLDNRR